MFPQQSTSLHHFSECCVVFSLRTKLKLKRTDGESAKAVREQVELSRYKSVLGMVENIPTFLKIQLLLLFLFFFKCRLKSESCIYKKKKIKLIH